MKEQYEEQIAAAEEVQILMLLHGECARTIFFHELRSIGKRTSERSERVSFLIRLTE